MKIEYQIDSYNDIEKRPSRWRIIVMFEKRTLYLYRLLPFCVGKSVQGILIAVNTE